VHQRSPSRWRFSDPLLPLQQSRGLSNLLAEQAGSIRILAFLAIAAVHPISHPLLLEGTLGELCGPEAHNVPIVSARAARLGI